MATAIGLLASGLVLFGIASSAAAAATASAHQATVSVSTANPARGSAIVVTGVGYEPNEPITLDLQRSAISLGTTRADATGDFGVRVALPHDAAGAQSILVSGGTSGTTASRSICIGGTCGGGSDGLATGVVALAGIAAIGLVLLAGGGLMALAGRRRASI